MGLENRKTTLEVVELGFEGCEAGLGSLLYLLEWAASTEKESYGILHLFNSIVNPHSETLCNLRHTVNAVSSHSKPWEVETHRILNLNHLIPILILNISQPAPNPQPADDIFDTSQEKDCGGEEGKVDDVGCVFGCVLWDGAGHCCDAWDFCFGGRVLVVVVEE